MPMFEDFTGKKFNMLTVTKDERGQQNNPRLECVCDCGKTCRPIKRSVKSGKAHSCGCNNHPGAPVTHGASNTRLHNFWSKSRHLFCPEWQDFKTLLDYVGRSDMGIRARDSSELIGPENNVVYERARHGMGGGIFVVINDVSMNLSDWGKFIGVTRERARVLNNGGRLEGRVLEVMERQNGSTSPLGTD